VIGGRAFLLTLQLVFAPKEAFFRGAAWDAVSEPMVEYIDPDFF
jgi:hypothetical protein